MFRNALLIRTNCIVRTMKTLARHWDLKFVWSIRRLCTTVTVDSARRLIFLQLYRDLTATVTVSSRSGRTGLTRGRVESVSPLVSGDNNGTMDKASHLSVILDLSPTQWHLSARPTNLHPLTLSAFLSQLLAFLNAHMACKDENSLAVFGAFPGKRCGAILLEL